MLVPPPWSMIGNVGSLPGRHDQDEPQQARSVRQAISEQQREIDALRATLKRCTAGPQCFARAAVEQGQHGWADI